MIDTFPPTVHGTDLQSGQLGTPIQYVVRGIRPEEIVVTTGTVNLLAEAQPDGRYEGTMTSAATLTHRYKSLAPLCLESLERSYNVERHLFDAQLNDGIWTPVDSLFAHETLTSSCIALIGLFRYGANLEAMGVDPTRSLTAIIGDLDRTGYHGGLGLILWANAAASGDRSATEILRTAGFSYEHLLDELLPQLTTMEIAWLTNGLLHSLRRGDSDADELHHAATTCAEKLMTNRFNQATSIMAHAGPSASLTHRARAHIANFADQIYSIQALATAHDVLGLPGARDTSTAIARRMCEAQGPLGQWWWHYDARRGHVAKHFAVYSVHQHGMAPMALHELSEAGGGNFDSEIALSMRWIDTNESGSSMCDEAASTIWRSLESPEGRATGIVRGVLETFGRPDPAPSTATSASTVLNRETRPYEWAWLLYAAAGFGINHDRVSDD